MKIQFTLNDNPYLIDCDPAEKLIDVLRKENLTSVKRGCMAGTCGACYVLVDCKVVPSCHIPVGIVMGCEIMTLDYFSKTDFYSDIIKGFEKAGVSMCGFCNAGKVFLAYEILNILTEPNREKVAAIASRLNDCCVEQNTFINGILYAYSFHFDKDKLRKNGHR